MEGKVNAITLKTVSVGEADAILTLFSFEEGIISVKVKGVKKAGAKLKFIAQPFCFAEIVYAERQDRKTVTGASLIDGFYPLCLDIFKTYAGLSVLEFLRIFAVENEPNVELFNISVNTLKNIAYGDIDAKIELVKYLIDGLKISGYAIDFTGCVCCGEKISGETYFDFSSGGGVCAKCADVNSTKIYPETYKTLFKIANGATENFLGIDVIRALKLLNHYVFTKTDKKIKSLTELIKLKEI